MNKPLYNFFEQDHRRVEAILDKAMENLDAINMEHYNQFRTLLLTHIKMEEKILFLEAQKANGNVPLPIAARLRLEHGAITSLMAIPPTRDVVKVLRYVLGKHDFAEEEPGGMYDACEALTKEQTQVILNQLAKVTAVPVLPPNPIPFAFEATKRSLLRAGYDYDAIVSGIGNPEPKPDSKSKA